MQIELLEYQDLPKVYQKKIIKELTLKILVDFNRMGLKPAEWQIDDYVRNESKKLRYLNNKGFYYKIIIESFDN